jgi:hypothetical protein
MAWELSEGPIQTKVGLRMYSESGSREQGTSTTVKRLDPIHQLAGELLAAFQRPNVISVPFIAKRFISLSLLC